jgi:hypothetical protein
MPSGRLFNVGKVSIPEFSRIQLPADTPGFKTVAALARVRSDAGKNRILANAATTDSGKNRVLANAATTELSFEMLSNDE